MLKKVKICNIALYNADRENCLRAYVNCFRVVDQQIEKFTVICFFSEQAGKWTKEGNENCSLENLLTAMNEQSDLMADTQESTIAGLFEASFVFG